ncbi:serine hydrolase domain-containing protein [Amphiplicatus metriothermophilus]|uniref:CubicO group peptidase, beta-lactamase class C family n=1 Tax=Amphiplicatus metriothermophilus TaxID=1519374 RepID=A0A239PZ92_9PROT|nr:serine hydrolase domain-containing protein [Amphiplicatus metriothermophilus]MBB5518310.1 CubicO group peptidase (beta-lactamase class C family) [Amphiplicatus metriothermophilus]SNT75565.1 CubicO group peptidase, beta-lactamase class C family [Amphiplicatus metriothermophilus]
MRLQAAILASFAAIALTACAGETPAPESAAASVDQARGISQDRLARIEAVLQDEVDAGKRAGFVAVVAHRGKIVYETAVGLADRENAVPMSQATRFRIASMTKPLVTAALMQLVEDGEVLLSDPVSRYIPAFAEARVALSHERDENGEIPTEPLKRPITVHHVLTHMGGIGYLFDYETDLGRLYLDNNLYFMEGDLAARVARLAELPLYEQPGEVWRYSYGTDIAGRIVEVASGQTLEAFMRARLFEPLGMSDTEFFLDESDLDRLAVVYAFDEEGRLVPSKGGDFAPDPNAGGFGWASGGAGLVATARDYMRFCLMLLNGGELDGARVLSPATVRLMLEPHAPVEATFDEWRRSNTTFALGGYIIRSPGLTGSTDAPGQWGWGGYYDTSFFISPADDLAVAVMAQREPGPRDPGSRAGELVKAIAFGALE